MGDSLRWKLADESLEANGNLGCWASSGYSMAGCAQLEQQLRACMDAPVCLYLTANMTEN